MLREFEENFGRYLLGGTETEAVAVALLSTQVDAAGGKAANRLRVHRNNFVSSLIEALGQTYPVVEKLVGFEFFREMARNFIRVHPPRDPAILAYGAAFPQFIETFSPAESVPYLADVARLEWHRQEAYHAEDAAPLDMRFFGNLDPQLFDQLRLIPHPSVRLMTSSYPVQRIWEVNSLEETAGGHVDLTDGPDHLLIARPFTQVIVVHLSAAAFDFTQAICTGLPLTEAYEEATQRHEDLDLQSGLADLIRSEIIVTHTLGEKRNRT